MKKPTKRHTSRDEILEIVAGAKQFKNILPLIEDDLRKSGVDVSALYEAFADVDQLYEDAKGLLDLPERFNTHFVPYGWVAYELLNNDVAKAAVELADQGDVAGAEQHLLDYYDGDTLRYGINNLKQIKAFQPRLRLLKLAAEDYSSGRYHACIPVVLAQIDGVISDLRGQGFFAEGADLTAWDSISANEDGLGRLAQILSKSLTRTRDEALTIPYRNGVMHGRDLRYDTKLAAAKAWCTLFALRELGMRTEQEPEEVASKPVRLSLEEELARLQRLQTEAAREKAQVEAWKPREVVVGHDIPRDGSPEAYPEGSPERVAVLFLLAWQKKNYGAMGDLMTSYMLPPEKKPGLMRAQYDFRTLQTFEILEVNDRGAATSTIVAALRQDILGKEVKEDKPIHLVYANDERKALVRGEVGGVWRITVGP